jgi:hypothetical protein
LAARSIDNRAFRFRSYRHNRFIVSIAAFHFAQTPEIGL